MTVTELHTALTVLLDSGKVEPDATVYVAVWAYEAGDSAELTSLEVQGAGRMLMLDGDERG